MISDRRNPKGNDEFENGLLVVAEVTSILFSFALKCPVFFVLCEDGR